MITAICGHEPNAGRTTVAINLAAMLARCGRDILLIDACANQDASRSTYERTHHGKRDGGFFCHYAATELSLTLAIERLAPRFKEVIVDTDESTAFAAASRSDCCLVVAGPDWDEHDRDEKMYEAAEKTKPELDIHHVVNRAYPKFRLDEFWDSYVLYPYALPSRRAFSHCWTGFGVTETIDLEEVDNIAINGMKNLFQGVYGLFETKPNKDIRIVNQRGSTTVHTIYPRIGAL